MRRLLPALVVAALVTAAPAAAFIPADPLAAKQWYLAEDHAFDAWETPPTNLVPVKVAIVDSGIDGTLPDFAGRIADSRSFVGGNALVDTEGHGTFVAGVIGANLDTQGIAGIAYTSQLLIAKVVKPDGTIPLEAEAAAIRWAADSGARVINLSLGGVRDPLHPNRDTYSPLEASAVAYAYAKGAVLVAAVGNGDEAFSEPWPYASYPAALPHVIGVSALTRSGNVPDFSNRDAVYNDVSAPGQGIFSTFPSTITSQRPICADQGFSDCGPDEYRNPEGTSFAAPQVSAAAAILFAVDPQLTNSQVATLIEHSADDVNAANGCSKCALLRDPFSGWGRLDVAKAVEALGGPLPVPDHYETNDNAGTQAWTLWGKQVTFTATLDYYDDQVDVYRIKLSGGERLTAKLTGGWAGANVDLVLWRPMTRRVDDLRTQGLRAAQSIVPGRNQRVTFQAPGRGWYYLEVKVASPGSGPYTLALAKTPPAPSPTKP
jgi:subtilisin family serine protease